MLLDNKIAVITGAASGIGKGIAERFAKAGARVVIADLNIEQAKATADAIQQNGGQALAVKMDVTSESEVNQAIASVVEQWGAIDVLVSNAGIQHIEALDTLSLANWQKMMHIHLDGAFLTTQACLKFMYKAGNGGSIIYIGSSHSKDASKLKAPYVTAKHGLIGLCKVVAKEGAAHGVRANVVCPGFVKTALVEKQIPEQAKDLGISEEEVVQKVLLGNTVDGEFTTVEDVAEAALFFASFKSNALTGQSLVVSHGWVME